MLISYHMGSPKKDCMCRAKTKTFIFENGQFSRHFVLDKNNCFFQKKHLLSQKTRTLFFLEKKHFLFFLKTNIFFGYCFFEKLFFTISKTFSTHQNPTKGRVGFCWKKSSIPLPVTLPFFFRQNVFFRIF